MGNWGGAGQGAIGGAATGAMVGSMVPGIGTALGAGLGGALGGLGGYFGGGGDKKQSYSLPGYDERQRALNAQIGGYTGPTMGPMQQASMGGEFRGGQLALMQQLQAQANGQGPSLASAQFDRSLQQGMNAQLGMAQSGVGNSALNMRNAVANTGTMTQDLAGQAAMARMQEQLNAQQQLGALTTSGRGQEMQGSQFNAGQFNNAALQQGQMDMQYNLGLRELEMRNAQLQQAGMQGYAGQQGPGLGTQILSGAGALGANYFSNYMNKKMA